MPEAVIVATARDDDPMTAREMRGGESWFAGCGRK